MEVIAVESSQFKHQQVENGLRQLVSTLTVGARLPSERALALTYGCNFLTVRRALKPLVEDGSVVRKVGSGTFVARRVAPQSSQVAQERIGVLAWQERTGYAHRVLQGVALAAESEGIEIRSAWTRDFATQGLDQARLLAEDGCGSIILPWFPHERAEEVRAFIGQCPLPVSLPLLIPGLERNCFEREDVFCSNLQACCKQLCEFFHALGRRQIAFLGPQLTGDPVLQRMLTAYTAFVSAHGLPQLCGLVRPGGQAMDQLAERWRGHRGNLAVLSYDDEHALRFMTAMHKLGLSAPTDFQIVGHNDSDASAFSDPPLTTIRQDFDYIGLWLIKNARALARGSREQSAELPRLQLLVRASCGGAGRIDETLRARLPGMELVAEETAEPTAA